ncbi:hypothetical protein BGZ83_007931 [Gryganskiella cystojenkinii]|nr:hypothetical protein BGZ83_007931 [Gryganskiella cystojenkinii]
MTTMRIPNARALRPVQTTLSMHKRTTARQHSLRSMTTAVSTTGENGDESHVQEGETSPTQKPAESIAVSTTTTLSQSSPTTNSSNEKAVADTPATASTITPESSTEKLYKKFNLKPSAEVGIRARTRARKIQQQIDQDQTPEAQSKAAKIHRLFETLHLGTPTDSSDSGSHSFTPNSEKETLGTSSPSEVKSNTKKKISESWKFLFDEGDLSESTKKGQAEAGSRSVSAEDSKPEMLDMIPGASTLFPAVSEHRLASSSTVGSTTSVATSKSTVSTDRWKDPRLKSSEKEAFRALFSSLFEKKSDVRENGGPSFRVQSLFSSFNRSGLEDSTNKGATATGSYSTNTTNTIETIADEDPMQVLRRQVESLSKRVDPIYLNKKPKTSSFRVMESTVGPQDWMNKDATLPQENALFALIREENKVAIRMRKELESRQKDIIKVKDFVDELLAPFMDKAGARSTEVKPSVLSLDGLLAQAILASSTTIKPPSSVFNLDRGKVSPLSLSSPTASSTAEALTPSQDRSLHPYLGQALVEHTRRQGLKVFIRAVRTESYKALIKSRWENWRDGAGCLEVLKEMQRNGALLDVETRSVIRSMLKDLGTAYSDTAPHSPWAVEGSDAAWVQYGWGEEEEAAPLIEMLRIVRSSERDHEQIEDLDKWSKRATDADHYSSSSRSKNSIKARKGGSRPRQ